MIYSATRRRSFFEGALNLAGPAAVTAAALWAVLFTPLIPYGVSFFVLVLWVVPAVLFCIVTHEAAHLVVGLLVHRPVRKILIGRGITIFTSRIGGIRVQVCANLTAGGAVYFSAVDETSDEAHILVTAAGPLANIATGLIAFAALPTGWPWLGTLVIAGLLLGVGNAIPSRFEAGGREHFTDGMSILRMATGRRGRSMFFEGEELAPDAERVTTWSFEAAMDSESESLTEAHLLAALDRDPAIHAVLAPAHIADLIHFPGPPNSLDVRPVRSAVVEQVYRSTFRIGRDLGVSRPNAACLCLGLMAVPSPVATRLKDSRVDEAALRQLVTVGAEAPPTPSADNAIQDLPLERWGAAADAVLALAFRIAMVDRADDTGTQHLLAAIVAQRGSRGAQALARKGFLLRRNDRAVAPGDPLPKPLPLTPEAQSAIASALARTGPTYGCGTGELCLGLASGTRSMARALFQAADLEEPALQEAIVAVPREESPAVGYTPAVRRMWELRATARLSAKRYLDSRADFLVLEQAAPNDDIRALNQNNVAWVSLMSGDPSLHAEALEKSRAAMAARADLLSIQGTHAFALLETGELNAAAQLLEKVIAAQTRPRDQALELCLLAICRARQGDAGKGTPHLHAAEELDPRCALLERARDEIARSPILR